jgi:hypothetical protein
MKSLLALLVLAATLCFAQDTPSKDMQGMNMPDHNMSQMAKQTPKEGSDASMHAMHSMEGHHMDMGPHMKMTTLRPPQAGDSDRAQKVVEVARGVMEKYKDYHVALDDHFEIFHPEVPQKQYHFTNYRYAFEAAVKFNPEHPTSLLYEKNGDVYTLVGVMYTAPKRFSEDDLNQRIPLSVAQWHEHVNYCAAPDGRRKEMLAANAKFGLRGSITTKEECDANGGEFHPVIFNWMVHLYPGEKNAAQIWAVDRQHAD